MDDEERIMFHIFSAMAMHALVGSGRIKDEKEIAACAVKIAGCLAIEIEELFEEAREFD